MHTQAVHKILSQISNFITQIEQLIEFHESNHEFF